MPLLFCFSLISSVLFTLPSESFLSFPHSFHFHVATYNKQYLEKSSILCCKSPMAWLTVLTIFRETVIFTVNPLWHGWSHKAIWWVQLIAVMYIFSKNSFFPLFVVSPMLLYDIFWKNMFTHYLLCIGHCTDFSLGGACSGSPQSLRVWPSLNSNFMVEHTKVGTNKTLVLLKTTDGRKKALVQYKCCTSNS